MKIGQKNGVSRTVDWIMSLTLLSFLVLTVSTVGAQDLAKVNQSVITQSDLAQSLGPLTKNENQKKRILEDPNLKHRILEDLIDREVLAQEAQKLKVDQDPEFQKRLEQVRRQLMLEALIDKKVAPQLTESKVKEFFEANKKSFNLDQVHAQQIIVPSIKEAQKVLKQARDPKEDFGALAQAYSTDPMAKANKGEMGLIRRFQFSSEFSNAVFSASKGEIVGPIQTLSGYHIVKILDKSFGKIPEFSEVEPMVKQAYKQKLTQEYVAELRSHASITESGNEGKASKSPVH